MSENEKELFDKIFYEDLPWERDVRWCDLCGTFAISCPKCKSSSCNGTSCDFCKKAYEEFHKKKTNIEDYLTPEEALILYKIEDIKRKMEHSLRKGENTLSFDELNLIERSHQR